MIEIGWYDELVIPAEVLEKIKQEEPEPVEDDDE